MRWISGEYVCCAGAARAIVSVRGGFRWFDNDGFGAGAVRKMVSERSEFQSIDDEGAVRWIAGKYKFGAGARFV